MGSYGAWVEWLESLWLGQLKHRYTITNSKHWKGYGKRYGTGIWECRNLADACDRYWWDGADLKTNESKLAEVSRKLQEAIEKQNHSSVVELCHDIVGWGAVARNPEDPTKKWLQIEENAKTLSNSIKRAVAILKNDDDQYIKAEFKSHGWPMNSATTKIFALADPESSVIIYDGRVGAALCYLVRKSGIDLNSFMTEPRLHFCWGADQKKYVAGQPNRRDPNGDGFKFGKLTNEDGSRVLLVARTSRMMKALATRTNTTPRHWEAAMFMIGYCVRG